MVQDGNTRPQQTSLFVQDVPQMPEGYYSGDQPNPHLRAFVEAHLAERPYDPEHDTYAVPAFDKPIETTKATAIYNMHTYWSKKPHDAIRQYILHYTQHGDLVLDPFCGSGSTALAALLENRKAVAIDRSPAATFITKNYCTPEDVQEVQAAFNELWLRVQQEIDWLYETRCDRCGGKASTAYTIYSYVFQCPRCLEKVPLFDCKEVTGHTAEGKPKQINVCPHCYARGLVEEISLRSPRFDPIPVLVSYTCKTGCKPGRATRHHEDQDPKKRQYFEQFDLGKLQEINQKDIPYWYPHNRMMNSPEDQERWGVLWRAGVSNFRTVTDLFTKRNLWALAAILDGIYALNKCRDALLFTFTSILFKASRMMAHNSDGIGRIQKGTYYIPQIEHDIHVGQFMEEALKDMIAGYHVINGITTDLIISTSDARNLDIPNSSVDYIFTDPPYSWKVQYGESNFLWEAFLKLDTHWHDDEIIVNEIRGRTENDWANMMRQAMGECYRVLKPGRWLSLCYHDTSEGTWSLIQDIMAEAGFLADQTESAIFIDAEQKSIKQITSDKITKRDLVISFRKPKLGEVVAGTIRGDEDQATFGEKVRAIIRDYLTDYPGATKDRIYDEVVSRMVRAGQMEAHNFEELLAQVAEEVREPVRKNLFENESPNLFGTHEIGRWYLKEIGANVLDAAESAKEDAAAEKLKAFISAYLKKHPAAEGVHYSDLFEQYVYTVKDKPRRPLAEWLLDYFYKTEAGTYRLPASAEEEQLKEAGRAQGTSRHIKRYLSYLQQGMTVPARERPNDATLAEWIRHCKRSGLYEQGKLLYEVGGLNLDSLSEEMQVNVEEDYQVCVRLLARAQGESKTAKKQK